MRGKLLDLEGTGELARITPAHAGKTDQFRSVQALDTDHPRACGENKLDAISDYSIVGSPPRMRGKQPLIFSWNG